MKKSTLILVGGYIIGLGAVGVLIILALPLVAIGDWRPFDTAWVRWVILIIVSLTALGYLGFTIYQRAQRARELTAGMAAGSEENTSQNDVRNLEAGMNDAVATLKKSTGKKGDALYDLPWYIIIGPPGAGKTTALRESGLKFPLTSNKAVRGVGGTRYCDWWFTENAVLIDTAGRYTTQDSDARVDSKSWLSFLKLLQRTRPKQPINGALICISVEDLLSLSPAQVEAHAVAIRSRLVELHENLKVDFPVYAIFSKADLIAGFMEFFGHLPEERRRAVWGATFQTTDKTANLVGEIPKEMDALIARLNQAVVDRLQDEPNPTARVQIFGFPSQVASLKTPVFEFLTRIFEPTRYHSNAILRGFYFTSGTQDGTPIDQLIGALARSFGAQRAGDAQHRNQGRSFFLGRLLTDVVFGEAGWVSTNPAALRRSLMLKTGAYAALALVCVGLTAAWWVSYGRNSGLIGDVHKFVADFGRTKGPLTTEQRVADHDFARVLPALVELQTMPAGYDQRNQSIAMAETFGLSQRSRLNVSADASYEQALHRLFLPRLMFRIEERLRTNLTNPAVVIEALPVYLMLGGSAAMDKGRVVRWWVDDWSQQLYPGAAREQDRQSLKQQLDNLLAIGPGGPMDVIEVDPALVTAAQAAILRIPVVDRAFELLRADSRRNSTADWSVRHTAGHDADLVFEGANGADLDTIRVSFFYTYAGFHQYFLGNVAQVASRTQDEKKFLGSMANQPASAREYETLPADLLNRYKREFVSAWSAALGQLRIRPLTADKPGYVALQAAAAPTSPIAALIESIRDETQLSRERPVQPPASGKPAPVASTLDSPFGKEAGAMAEPSSFRPYFLLADGARGQRGLDELLRELNDVYAALILLNDPNQTAQGQAQFRTSLGSLKSTATRFPDPFRGMVLAAVGAFDTDATATSVARLKERIAAEVTSVCQQAITGKYPFQRASAQDMPVQDFQRLFGPSGTIASFYTANLTQFIDTSKATWTWNAASPVSRLMSPTLVRDLQRADDIRSAFFAQGAGFGFAVKNLMVSDSIASARLEIDTGAVTVEKPGNLGGFNRGPGPPAAAPPVGTFQWPGFGVGGASLTFDPSGGEPPRMNGPWALFRLLDTATLTPARSGEPVVARFGAGDRQAQYQFSVATPFNPFNLAALREFRCPAP